MKDDYTKLHWDSAAFVVIDVQNDFVLSHGVAPIEGAAAVVPSIAAVLNYGRENGIPIIHIVRCYLPDGSNVDLCRKKNVLSGTVAVAPGTSGAEIATELKPDSSVEILLDSVLLLSGKPQQIGSKEWVFYKPRWGAFYHTELEEFLWGRGIDSLIFMGINFPNCPRASIYQASERDFRIGLVIDAMSHLYGKDVEELERIGVNMLTVADVTE